MISFRQTGSVLITLIIAMLLMGVLGVGIYSLTTSSTFTGLLSNYNDQAYQLAQAGIRYKIKNLSETGALGDFKMPDDNHKFNIAYNDTTKIITSTGIVNEGQFSEARRVITYNVATYWKLPDTGPGGVITPGPGTNTNEIGNAIVTNPDGSFNLGNNTSDASGSIWYQGSSSAGNCNSGACQFNYGLRAYFDFIATEDNSTDSKAKGDGFTFTVLSAINNTRDRTGGPPPGISIGEFMGYSGPGNTATMTVGPGEGLRPPKMALEFDTYPNIDGNVCNSASRNDNNAASTAFRNHLAVLFWGDALTGSCGAYPRASYDDNRHGSGSGDTSPTPVNSYNGYAGGGYYEGVKSITTSNCVSAPGTTCNWMEDGHTYSARVEIIRITSGTSGLYKLMGWIYRDTEPPADLTQYRDLTSPYTSTTPQIIRTVTLSAADHNALSQVFFGFTEGTGGVNQNIKISNFKAFFPTTCPAILNPASQTVSYSGATGQTVTVTAGTGCSWTAVSNAAWITITGGTSGAGPGIVTYNVALNATGETRTGTITIAGQTFTITQASCMYTVGTPSDLSFVAGGGSGTVSVTASAGCSWTTSNNGNAWITITPTSSTGTGAAQTVTYTVAANTGAARNGTMTIAGQTFTVTQDAYCRLTIIDDSFACKSSSGSSRVYIKVYLEDGLGNAITDATVTYSVSGGGGSGTLTNLDNGYYGGNRTSDCGLGDNCARTASINGSRTVTVTATRTGCTSSPLTKTMTVP